MRGKNIKHCSLPPSLFFKHIAAKKKTCSKPSKEGESSQQTTLDLVVHAKEELQTEIRWVIATVMYNLSSNAASNMTQLFGSLFPDSKVAKHVTLGRTKISYIMNFGLAPYFKSLLIEEKTQCYIISFDESLNKITQNCQMDLLVRFWNEVSKQVVRYLNSTFLGHSAASDILQHFNEETRVLNLSKMLQVSMDGLTTNMKFCKELSEYCSVSVS